MNRRYFIRAVQITVLALAVVAVFQEIRKPPERRNWHGRVLGFIPYEFRLPTGDRFKESFWNPYERYVLTPTIFGIGWTLNFYALFENLGMIHQIDFSEESFLMPNKRMRQILTQNRSAEG